MQQEPPALVRQGLLTLVQPERQEPVQLVLLGPKPQGLEQTVLPELSEQQVQRQPELARPERQEPPWAQQLLA